MQVDEVLSAYVARRGGLFHIERAIDGIIDDKCTHKNVADYHTKQFKRIRCVRQYMSTAKACLLRF